jgi:CelD/BcsL family acetyltransferase involved in cellulose biosynthesis
VAAGDPHQTGGRPPSGVVGRRQALPAGVEVHTRLEALREEWDALADATGAAPFVRPGWVEPWMRAFGAGTPLALAVRNDGRLAGVLPLQARAGSVSSPTNWQTPLFGPVVADAAAASALAKAALAIVRRRADLWFLDPGVAGSEALGAAAAESGFGLIERTIARSPYVAVEGSFDVYMSGLNRKFRKDIGRRWRRLEDQGEVRVAYEEGSERLEDLLTEGFRLEGSGWKTEAGTAIASDPVRERFYREVARWAAERGWLRLAFLYLDDRAIAFDLCIEADGACYVLKGGFDVEARSLGPGTLLTHHELERAFELGFDSYELLGQEDDYKRSWTSTVRERVRVQAFPPSPLGVAEYAAWRHGRPLAKRLQAAAQRLSDRRSSPSH